MDLSEQYLKTQQRLATLTASIAAMHQTMKAHGNTLQEIKGTLQGNGKDGLVREVAVLKERDRVRERRGLIGTALVASGVAAIITLLGSIMEKLWL